MPDDRRSTIADAAIRTLALAGSRGLTHRAVDREAGLPLGSTSYYLRTRADLLKAAVDRLAELDSAEVADRAETSLVDDLAAVAHRALTTDRTRLLARYELTLESVRRPELRELMTAGTQQVRGALAARLGGDDELADTTMALIDGLLLTDLTASTDGHVRTADEIRRALIRLLGSR